MIHQKILETLYSDGPQSYRDLKYRLRADKTSEIAFPAMDLLMGGLIVWDDRSQTFSYREDAWVA